MTVNMNILEWVVDKTHLKIEAKRPEEYTVAYLGKMALKGLAAPVVLFPASAASTCWFTGKSLVDLTKVICLGRGHQDLRKDLGELFLSLSTLLSSGCALTFGYHFLAPTIVHCVGLAAIGYFSVVDDIVFASLFTLLIGGDSLLGLLPLSKISEEIDVKIGSTSIP